MLAMKKKGEKLGMEVRGVSDHDFIESVYFRDQFDPVGMAQA